MKTYEEILYIIDNRPECKADISKIFFTSDLHFNHDSIISTCERPCTKETHNDWILNRINSHVTNLDHLYILGDVSLDRREVITQKYIDKINGNKSLIIGNHDKRSKKFVRLNEITQIKDFTYDKYDLNIHIVLCHYPIASWNRQHYNSIHLYGHSHCKFINNGLSFDVGIDRKYIWKPYNLYEIIQIMDLKQKGIPENEIIEKLFPYTKLFY